MLIKAVTKAMIPEWITLAREVEPIFEEQMADNTEFQKFMKKAIEK